MLISTRPIATFLTILLTVMFFLNMINPEAYTRAFSITGTTIDQVYPWQFITYMFYLPPGIWSIFNIMVFFWFGSSLEGHWGSTFFAVFVFTTVLLHGIASFLLGFVPVMGGWSLDLCLMVAFGFNFPSEVIYLFFIIPVRVKILAIISLVVIGIQFIMPLDALITPGQFFQVYTEALVPLPSSLASVLDIFFSYATLLIFFKYIFGRGHISQAVRRIKTGKRNKQIIQEQKKNVADNQQFKVILEKNKSGNELSASEKGVLHSLAINDPALCSVDDFNGDDIHCLKCDMYGDCVKRAIT